MAHPIFFSWQSDTPSPNGRGFLRKALEKACEELANDAGVSEAVRDEGLSVDSDTQGVAGQPPLVETILKKIDASSVFVADVTFTGARMSGGLTPNPNVLIEYGWAMKSLTHSRVISVMNEVYGKASRDSLPFDLAHIRWPLRYSLKEDATEEERGNVKKKLVSDLKEAIKISLETIPTASRPEFQSATPKDGPARFRAPNEPLGFNEDFPGREEKPKEVSLSRGSAMYLRLVPTTNPEREWTTLELKENAKTFGHGLSTLIGQSGGYGHVRASDGWGVYRAGGEKAGTSFIETPSVVFAFEKGEIWSIDTTIASYSKSIPFLESYFNVRLQQYALFLKTLGVLPPYRWVAGITGVKGRTIDYPLPPNTYRMGSGPICVDDVIESEGIYKDNQSPAESLLPFYKKIFAKCGLERPEHLNV